MFYKKIFFSGLILLIFSHSSFSQSNWQWLNPKPQRNDLHSVSFINVNTGIVVADCGTIIRTINAGSHWNVIPLNSSNDLRAVTFASSAICYAGGIGIVLKSTDAGLSWFDLIKSSVTTFDLFFSNENTGYAAGVLSGRNIILKTSNGGISWDSSFLGSGNGLTSITFTNLNSGFSAGSGKFCKTTNAGLNWIIQNSPSNSQYQRICFLDSAKGFISTVGIYLTTNEGNSWIIVQNASFTDIAFADPNTGYALSGGQYNHYYKTTNGGYNWNGMYLGIYNNSYSIQFVNNMIGYFVGSYGGIYKIDVASGNITSLITSFVTADMNCVDAEFINNILYIAFYNGYQSAIRKTSDGGNSFLQVSSPIYEIKDLIFINSLTGIAAGSTNANLSAFIKTTNGGSNWTYTSYGYNGGARSLTFINNNTGYACGSNRIFKTTNTGDTWINIDVTQSINSIFFINVDTGFGVGSNNIYKTTNGALTWSTYQTSIVNGMRSIFFTSNNTGYACGGQGKIYKTTNGGNNWLLYQTETTDILNKIYFVNPQTGYAASYQGVLLKTTNSGNNWFNDNIKVCGRSLNAIEFVNQDTGYVVGNNGVILKTTNGSITFAKSIESINPETFRLYQNYPNPFNPETVISYQLPITSFIILKVYNVLGNEVATLINEKQNPGSYSVDFNGANYPSGIYYYHIVIHSDKLEAGNFSEVKKMILIK